MPNYFRYYNLSMDFLDSDFVINIHKGNKKPQQNQTNAHEKIR